MHAHTHTHTRFISHSFLSSDSEAHCKGSFSLLGSMCPSIPPEGSSVTVYCPSHLHPKVSAI
uniref:Uncharacterized protein n=1 Tax=Anguilla anguilla TaxID=7936 RepID=A0A0E9SFA9_ANGAN